MPKTNDAIRRIPDGFDRSLRTLLELRAIGVQDIGFGMTVQDLNFHDIVPLYNLAQGLGYEFATATLHNSHYFFKWDNKIEEMGRNARAFVEKEHSTEKHYHRLMKIYNQALNIK